MSCTIRVTNISKLIEKEHIDNLFGAIGTVTSCSLSEPDVSGTRTAIVVFSEPAFAQAALYLNDTPLGDTSLAISLVEAPPNAFPVAAIAAAPALLDFPAANPLAAFMNPLAMLSQPLPTSMLGGVDLSGALTEAARKRNDEIARTIYVGNLDSVVTEEHLKLVFQVAGPMLYIKIAGDVNTPSGRYGFIEFAKLDSVPIAMQLTGTVLAGRPLKVGRANVRVNVFRIAEFAPYSSQSSF